jgi:hypothetical protein
MTDKIVYLMRGLPACGKSYTANRIAGESGVVLETDEYFYTQVGDDPTSYDYSDDGLDDARVWNFDRFRQAIAGGISPIVVDRGNGLNVETQEYARYAVERDYEVQLQEPDSDWWQELRILLKYKRHVSSELFDHWAEALANKTRDDHRVPVKTIRRWMSAWKYDVTVEHILKYDPDR